MKERFVDVKFSDKDRAMVQTIEGVMNNYAAQGFTLSLRQLYYQLVSRVLVPENTERMYKKVGALVSNGRLAGLLDWAMIEDRGRSTAHPYEFTSTDPVAQLRAMARAYTINKWRNRQPIHIEVMVEKDALSGVLGPVCSELQVAFTANKGYSSASAMYEAGQRLRRVRADTIEVLYMGDHDPSGIDMTRDVEERLSLFARRPVNVRRIALNMDQVDELNPPENPAKLTDPRAARYVEEFGDSSWELDAIEPNALAQLVRDAVLEVRDEDLWEAALGEEESTRQRLHGYADKLRDWMEADDALGLDDEEETDEEDDF